MPQEQATYLLEQILNGKKITRRQFTGWLAENAYPHSKNTITRILTFINEYYGFKLKAKRSKYAEENHYYIDWDESDPEAMKKYNFAKTLLLNGFLHKAFQDRLVLDKYISISNYNENKGLEYFTDLFRAVVNRNPVRLRYQSFFKDKAQEFTIEPVLLREYLNRWYVISQNTTQEEKHAPVFALDRIHEMEVLHTRRFKQDKTQNFAEAFKHTIGASLSGKIQEVLLQVSDQQAKYFETLPFHSSQKFVKKGEGNSHIYSYRLRINYELLQWLKHFGQEIKVLSPKHLQDRLIEELKNTLKQY